MTEILQDVESYPATIHNGSVVHNPVVGKLFDKPYTFRDKYKYKNIIIKHVFKFYSSSLIFKKVRDNVVP